MRYKFKKKNKIEDIIIDEEEEIGYTNQILKMKK